MDSLFALVLAGGRGTRFWPLSRADAPKQCLSVAGRPSPLTATIERLLPIIPPHRILIVTGKQESDIFLFTIFVQLSIIFE